MAAESLLEKQAEAKQGFLALSCLLLFCYNASLGCCYVYGGLTLEHHQGGSEADSFIQLDEEEATWYMSIVPILNMLGSVAAYPMGEWLGRKKVLILSTLLNIMGFVIIYFSQAFAPLACGRGLSSFGLGLGVMMPFVLISEITTIKARAPLSVINTMSISFGILASYVFIFAFPAFYLVFFASGLSLVFLLLSPFLPESPHFLVRKGKLEEAMKTLQKLRGSSYRGVEEEVQEVILVTSSNGREGGSLIQRWKQRTFLQPLGILVVLMFLIALNGVDCPLNFYGPSMFSQFGFSLSPRLLACVIPVGQLFGYAIAPLIMTRISKKLQYIGATIFMAISLGVLSLSYWAQTSHFEPITLPQVGLVAGSLGLTLGYGMGMGSVSYAMPGELLSPEDKAIGINIAQCIRMLGTAGVLKVYPSLVSSLGYPLLFICHAASLISAALFVICCLPETKNKTLTEIHQLFSKQTKIEQKSSVAV